MEQDSYKYSCDKCGFYCQFKSLWDKHVDTELHKTGKRKKRYDCKDPYKCTECDHETRNIVTHKKHILNAHSNKETRKKEFKFYCDYCDFGTFSKNTYETHNKTKRHILVVKRNKNLVSSN